MLNWSGSHAAVVAVLGAAAAVVYALPRPVVGGSDLAACPMDIAGLSGTDVPVEEFVLDELDPNDMIYRTYRGRAPEESVWLVVAYFQNARYGAHDPEVCYRSQGWRIEELQPVSLETRSGAPLDAELFRVSRRGEERLVMYWWYISDEKSTSDHRSFLNSMALDGILRGASHGSFVRVSTREWPSEGAARARLESFAGRVLTELPGLLHTQGKAGE